MEQLHKVGRLQAALHLVIIYGIHSITTARLALRALQQLQGDTSTHSALLGRHGIQQIIKGLNRYRLEVGERQLALLEWSFLPVFDPDSPAPETLHHWLQQDPAFFVEIIVAIYRPSNRKDDTEEELSESELSARSDRVLRAQQLLRSWSWHRTEDEAQETEIERLRKWINEARELLYEADRLVVGEQQIGQVLGRMTDATSGNRPAIVVRELLEELRSENIALGVRLALVNSRGATIRGPDEGGDQERLLAADYRQRADNAGYRWPIIADILRSIADGLDREAHREDEEAEQFRSGIIQ